MLDGNTSKQIQVQLSNVLYNFTSDEHIYDVKIDIDTHEFIISTYISTFDTEGNCITLNSLKMYLRNAEIPYVQRWINEIKLSEDNAVKLLALLRLGGY